MDRRPVRDTGQIYTFINVHLVYYFFNKRLTNYYFLNKRLTNLKLLCISAGTVFSEAYCALA